MAENKKPKLAVYKFSSCDGCQLSILDLEDELLALTGAVEISFFLEARRKVQPGPYDIGLVEGSISTPEEAERIARGRNYLRSHGIADDAYDVHVVHDCKLRELDGQRFALAHLKAARVSIGGGVSGGSGARIAD